MTSTDEKISSIIKMGYDEELAKKAFKTNGNDVEKTVNFLKKLKKYGCDFIDTQTEDDCEYEDESTEDDDDPLKFIKAPKRLEVLKKIVYQEEPEGINTAINSAMIALSMGDWEEITHNQEGFLDLLSDNKEVKYVETMKYGKLFTAKDKKAIEKIVAIGYPEYLVEQAYYACGKNVDAAKELLKSNQ